MVRCDTRSHRGHWCILNEGWDTIFNPFVWGGGCLEFGHGRVLRQEMVKSFVSKEIWWFKTCFMLRCVDLPFNACMNAAKGAVGFLCWEAGSPTAWAEKSDDIYTACQVWTRFWGVQGVHCHAMLRNLDSRHDEILGEWHHELRVLNRLSLLRNGGFYDHFKTWSHR